MSTSAPGLYAFGPFRMDVQRRVLTRGGHVVPLAPQTFDLLVLLVQSDGRAVSKQELMAALWPDTFVEEANLSFQISTLRKAPARAARVRLTPSRSTGTASSRPYATGRRRPKRRLSVHIAIERRRSQLPWCPCWSA